MEIEFDPKKNIVNIAKHGIDMRLASEMEEIKTREDRRRNYGEIRWLAYGLIKGRLHILWYTKRRDDVWRVIGLRKANNRERKEYAEKS